MLVWVDSLPFGQAAERVPSDLYVHPYACSQNHAVSANGVGVEGCPHVSLVVPRGLRPAAFLRSPWSHESYATCLGEEPCRLHPCILSAPYNQLASPTAGRKRSSKHTTSSKPFQSHFGVSGVKRTAVIPRKAFFMR